MKKKQVKFQLRKIVECRWTDASTTGGWNDQESYKEHTATECITVGYALVNDSERVVIATTQAEDGSLNGAIAIPKGWIRSIKVIRS